METEFPYLVITKKDRALVGKKDPDTRIYRRGGPQSDSGKWLNGLCDRFPDEHFVSPGGVCMYAGVSRAAVYKRINAGKLTAFCYHSTKWRRTLFGGVRKTRETPFMFIPTSECEAWGKELEARVGPPDDPGWLSDREYYAEERKLDYAPKHKGKTSPPKWKRKKKAGRQPLKTRILSLLY
jgi:hypothetical protein